MRDAMGELKPGQYNSGELEVIELDASNAGASITAGILREIAETGEHHGTFGGPEIEATAQAILALWTTINVLTKSYAASHSANVVFTRELAHLRNLLQSTEKNYAREHAWLNEAAEAAESDLDQVANVIRRLSKLQEVTLGSSEEYPPINSDDIPF